MATDTALVLAHAEAAAEAAAAEQAFTAETVRLFGKDACNRRYDATRAGWDSAAIEAGERKHRADEARHNAYRALLDGEG